ncbi:hypothetical protein [Methylocystis sp. SC2]|uniref:hypothetical protein n=1 Tax=Methylocystis sp. (strain SC2) TaxID=187303 RepID=UPI00027AEA34|nr:hypothetical protein [Methylocystis sp. SC2]CCJ08009.1 Hypothetical protein BN69_2558 [Methylocystis sp. SC2]
MSADDIVQARIDPETKRRAAAPPFEARAPNAESVEVMNELAERKGERFDTGESLFEDLGL